MFSCHFIRINVGNPSPPSSIIGLHMAVGPRKEKNSCGCGHVSLWWLPKRKTAVDVDHATDATLILSFASDSHVNEVSLQRICVF